jgi:hypothetical protein
MTVELMLLNFHTTKKTTTTLFEITTDNHSSTQVLKERRGG